MFDKRSVETKAVQVDAQLSPDDPVWQQGDPVPARALRVTGRLSSAGKGRFYWHGKVAGDVTVPCRRCLADAKVQVQDESHVIFAEADSEEAEDPDVYVLDERSYELDLRPVVREQWLLNVPSYAVCREDCKGICSTCGKDLNEGPCACPESRDSRWDALRRVPTKD
ncbi:MAG TPA: DUF177 domain-containing protein [Gemmatimonadaceae bacterium]|nr:DUF177 domain-containing protein [Gemmatimonadaceae bacterium]